MEQVEKEGIKNCEPSGQILEPQIFENILTIFKKLTQLGFTYYNGKVAIIQYEEEE